MDVGHVIPEAIRELLEKRGTFQAWLNRLDELGSEFRPEVADKVRSDYASRLGEVETELAGHRAELESALAGRTAAVEKVAAEHDARSAELEEIQLRHAVGEFDDAEWESRRAEHQVMIDELEADLTAQRSAVASLQTVLRELTGQGAAIASSDEIEADEALLDEAVVAADIRSAGPVVGDVDDEAAWMTQPFDDTPDEAPEVDELEEAQEEVAEEVMAVVEEEVEVGEAVEAAAEEAEVASKPMLDEDEPAEFMDELEFLESLSLDDADNFDAVSAMLDEDEGDAGADEKSKRETGDL